MRPPVTPLARCLAASLLLAAGRAPLFGREGPAPASEVLSEVTFTVPAAPGEGATEGLIPNTGGPPAVDLAPRFVISALPDPGSAVTPPVPVRTAPPPFPAAGSFTFPERQRFWVELTTYGLFVVTCLVGLVSMREGARRHLGDGTGR